MAEQGFALGESRLEKNKRTQVWRIKAPGDPRIREAGRILREGGLVAFPTETVYGLGANGLDGQACARIYAAKGRPSDNPLILHVASLEEAKALAREWPEKAQRAANKLWPGPLTMIVPAADCVPRQVTAGLDTVAIRFPADAVAQALIEAAGVPVAAPSANLSGRPSPTAAGHVLEDLGGRIDVILDGGPCKVGLESTIIDLSVEPPALLRPGDITAETLAQILGPLEGMAPSPAEQAELSAAGPQLSKEGPPQPAKWADLSAAGLQQPTGPVKPVDAPEPLGEPDRQTEFAAISAESGIKDGQAKGPKAPGMKYRHYAPKAPVTVLLGEPAAVAAYVLNRILPAQALEGEKSRTALLLCEETWRLLKQRESGDGPFAGQGWYCRDMGSRNRPREMAARLYDALRACDTEKARQIFVEGVNMAGQGAAVMNRLKKAAGNRLLLLD